MYNAYVIGDPVEHSLSPIIFQFLSDKQKIKLNYQKKRISKSELENFLSEIKNDNDFIGLNVTIPHKIEIIKFLNEYSNEVLEIGAVNVVKCENKKLKGFNTDAFGFVKSLTEITDVKKIHKSLIFGRGGASKACVFGIKKHLSSKIEILGRNDKVLGNDFDIIINATPVGMKNNLLGPPWEKINTKSDFIAYDLIYNPIKTTFMKWAIKNNASVVSNGLMMLIYQALKTWEIWFGETINNKKIIQELKLELERQF